MAGRHDRRGLPVADRARARPPRRGGCALRRRRQRHARAFRFIEIGPERGESHTTHALAPEAVLDVYGRALRQPPPSFTLCIRSERFELGEGLSPEASERLEAARAFVSGASRARGRSRTAGARPARDDRFPNPAERLPNPAERNPSRAEQIANPAERNQNSLSLFFNDLRHNRGLIPRPPLVTARPRRRSGRLRLAEPPYEPWPPGGRRCGSSWRRAFPARRRRRRASSRPPSDIGRAAREPRDRGDRLKVARVDRPGREGLRALEPDELKQRMIRRVIDRLPLEGVADDLSHPPLA